MALDPSIILGGINAADVAAKTQATLAQQQATRQNQQLQNYQVAQAKQDYQDQQNLKQAWRAAAGDPDKTIAAAAQLGVSPKAIQAFQASQLKMQNDLADLHKKQTETGKTELEVLDTKHKGFADLLDAPANAKTDTEFQLKKNQAIQQALTLGKITPKEVEQYSGMNQDQVKDLQAGFRGALANSEIAKNNAEGVLATGKKAELDATLGGKIADSLQKQKSNLSGELEQAYKTGGADAYGKVLAAKDPTGNLGFAAPDALKSGSTADAVKAIRDNAMTSEQKTQAEQAAKNEADTQANRAQQLQLQKISTQIQQQHLNLDYQKTQAAMFAAGLGADGKPLAGQGADLLKVNAQNTSDGRVFIDQDTAFKALPKGEQAALRAAAAANGVPLLSGKEAASVKDADTARNTLLGVFGTFMKNSSDHNGMIAGTGRYLINKATTATGNNPELDAANNNFLATIEALKSAGGAGSGLRITGAEITKMYAMKPQLSDSQQTLQAKMGQINELLQSKLNSSLHQVPVTSGSSKAAAPAASTKVLEIGSQKQYDALPSGAIYTENGVKYRKP